MATRQTSSRGRSRADGNKTRQDLINAADRLLPKMGLAATTSRKIAAEAGTTVASVNYHFGSKDGLITEVVANHMVPVMQQMATDIEALTPSPGRDGVVQVLTEYSRTMLGKCMTDPILREAMGVLFSNPELATQWRANNISPYLERVIDVLVDQLEDRSYREVRWRFNLFVDCVSGQIVKRMGFSPEQDMFKGIDEFVTFMTDAFMA